MMRKFHRWVGFLAALFLALIAGTGVFMQVQRLWESYHPVVSQAQPLPMAELSSLFENTIAAARRAAPGAELSLITVRMQGDRSRGEVLLADPDSRELSFDAESGVPLIEGGPAGTSLGVLMLRLHRGDILGLSGYWISLFCGVALFTLGVTGLLLYTKMFLQRAKRGRRSLLW
jgi:uncharacterized iron-regulated membrane protein